MTSVLNPPEDMDNHSTDIFFLNKFSAWSSSSAHVRQATFGYVYLMCQTWRSKLSFITVSLLMKTITSKPCDFAGMNLNGFPTNETRKSILTHNRIQYLSSNIQRRIPNHVFLSCMSIQF